MRLVELDVVCRRYKILPSEAVKISPEDYQFNMLVASVAIEHEIKQMEKSKRSRNG